MSYPIPVAIAPPPVPMPRKKFIKILYVQDQVNEKSWCRHLGDLASSIQPTCLFTVVTNAFSALEQLEITRFDLVIAQRNLPQFQAMELIKILRRLRCATPFIILSEQNHFPSIVEEVNLQPDFYGTVGLLAKTYTGQDLRYAIFQTLSRVIPMLKDTAMDCFVMPNPLATKTAGRKRKHEYTAVTSRPPIVPPRLQLAIPTQQMQIPVDENYSLESPYSHTTLETRTSSFDSFEPFLAQLGNDPGYCVEPQAVPSSSVFVTAHNDDAITSATAPPDAWLDFLFHALA